jgi:uncharacterized protein YcbK (DUF882 family)
VSLAEGNGTLEIFTPLAGKAPAGGPTDEIVHEIRAVLLLLVVSTAVAPLFCASAEEPAVERSMSFVHTHTGETISVVYRRDGELVAEARTRLNHFLRDHRTGDVHEIDPGLFDILWEIRRQIGSDEPFHLVSGYRSARTNEKLRKAGRDVGKKSMHVKGAAIDFRLPGVDTTRLRDIALSLKRGGVGYYRKSDFIHVDTGRVRRW